MNSKQRAYLRKIGQMMDPIIRVGKEGIKTGLIESVNIAFGQRELLKVKILQNSDAEKQEVARFLTEGTGSELIHILGGTMLLFKTNKKFNDISTKLRGMEKRK